MIARDIRTPGVLGRGAPSASLLIPGYKSLNTYPTGVGCQDDVLCNRSRAPATSNHYKRTASNKNPTAPPHGARLPGFGLCRIGGRTASGAVGRHEIGHGIEYIFRLIDQLLGRGWVVAESGMGHVVAVIPERIP